MHITRKALLSIFVALLVIVGASNYYAHQYRIEKRRLAEEERAASVALMQEAELTLHVGETKGSHGIIISFDGVAGDSRCAKGVACIQKGKATISLSLKKGTTIEKKEFSVDSPATVFEGIGVVLVSVNPEPVSDKEIKISDYTVTMRVAAPDTR